MSEHVHDENCNHDHESQIDLLRLTYLNQQMQFTLDTDLFAEDPATWGTVLADLAWNICEAMADTPEQRQQLLHAVQSRFLEAISAMDLQTKK
jgi:hypothetical protein